MSGDVLEMEIVETPDKYCMQYGVLIGPSGFSRIANGAINRGERFETWGLEKFSCCHANRIMRKKKSSNVQCECVGMSS